jgi:hypothetical protein
MTPDLISTAAAIILSLAASYLPGFSTWFDQYSPNHKRLLMLGLMALTTAAAFGFSCLPFGQTGAGFAAEMGINVTCDHPGLIALLRAFVLAAIANQTTFQLSPQKECPSETRA